MNKPKGTGPLTPSWWGDLYSEINYAPAEVRQAFADLRHKEEWREILTRSDPEYLAGWEKRFQDAAVTVMVWKLTRE